MIWVVDAVPIYMNTCIVSNLCSCRPIVARLVVDPKPWPATAEPWDSPTLAGEEASDNKGTDAAPERTGAPRDATEAGRLVTQPDWCRKVGALN